MSFVKQPPLFLTVPIKVFRDPDRLGIFYSAVLAKTYGWTCISTPSGEIMWNSVETNKTTEELKEIKSEDIPATLYETLKLFYVGKPKNDFRGYN